MLLSSETCPGFGGFVWRFFLRAALTEILDWLDPTGPSPRLFPHVILFLLSKSRIFLIIRRSPPGPPITKMERMFGISQPDHFYAFNILV